MKNRLQFRYCDKIFSNVTEIENYLRQLFLSQNNPLKGTSLIAEPLVLFYKDASEGVEKKKAVLAIGRDGNGISTGYADYFLIDIEGANQKISEISGKTSEVYVLKGVLYQEISARTESIKTLSGNITTAIETEKENRETADEKIYGILKNICNSVELNNDGEDMGTLSSVCFDHRYIEGSKTVIDAIRKLSRAIEATSGNVESAIEYLSDKLEVTISNVVCGRTLTSYTFAQGGVPIGTVDIPVDWRLKKGEIVRGLWNGDVFYKNQGQDLAMQFTLVNEKGETTSDADSVYVKLNHLIYNGGDGITITAESDNKNTVSIKLDTNSETAKYLSVSSNGLMIDGIGTDIVNAKNSAVTEANNYTNEKVNVLNSVVSGENHSVCVTVNENQGKLASLTVSTPDFENIYETKEDAVEKLGEARAYADSAISRAVSSVYRVMGSVTNITDLDDRTLIPNPQKGDVYNVIESAKTETAVYAAGTNFVFVGSGQSIYGKSYHGWDPLGGETTDMSLYVTHEYLKAYSAATKNYIDLQDSVLSGNIIAYVNEQDNDVKQYSDEQNTILSGNIISYIDGLSGATKQYVNAQDELVKQYSDEQNAILSGNLLSYLYGLSGASTQYVDAQDELVKQYSDSQNTVLSGQLVSYINSLSGVSKPYVDAQDEKIVDFIGDFYCGNFKEQEGVYYDGFSGNVAQSVNEVLDGYGSLVEVAESRMGHVDIHRSISKLSVLKDFDALSSVTAAGQYLVDAFAIKTMWNRVVELIASATCNPTTIRNYVADMIRPVDNEIKVAKEYESGSTTDVRYLNIGFADDAIFSAQLPNDYS